jgi:hypothetical protein
MSAGIVGEWMFNIGARDVWIGESFKTKEMATEEGKAEVVSDNKLRMKQGYPVIKSFEVGQIAEIHPSGVDIESILENVAENTSEQVGGEAGEDYLCDVSKEDSDELEQRLNNVLFAWMEEHGYEPDFWIMENIEEISI